MVPIFSKTISEWQKQIELYSSICYEKYIASLNDMTCSGNMSNIYCSMAKNNSLLRDVLIHIKLYDSYFDPIYCNLCKADKIHILNNELIYKKYKKWINIAILNSNRELGAKLIKTV